VACDTEERLFDASIAPAHRAPSRGPVAAEPAIAPWRLRLPRPVGQLVAVQRATATPPPEGVGFRVERPPRG